VWGRIVPALASELEAAAASAAGATEPVTPTP
jgi:hypothetical protein